MIINHFAFKYAFLEFFRLLWKNLVKKCLIWFIYGFFKGGYNVPPKHKLHPEAPAIRVKV